MTSASERFPRIPGFEILGELGSGGMGAVYLARHHGPHGFEKLVALKVLHPGYFETEAVRAMFIDEARLAARLAHPCIAQVYSFGEADGTLYFVMEHVTGLTFSQLIRSPTLHLSPLICACLAARVCRGLHAAHELRNHEGLPLDVVHRDVTPQNLLVTFDGEVKILDFGIALMQERTAPATHQQFVRGKPTYLAPEQREKQEVDRRADIYSLSIVLFEMLTRRKLFTFAMTVSSAWKQLAQNIPPPSSVVDVPSRLDEIVLRGLAFHPEDRFQTAREMALALEEVIEMEGSETIERFAERELTVFREAHLKETQSALKGELEITTQLMRSRTAVDEAPPPRPETPTKESSFQTLDPQEIIELVPHDIRSVGDDSARSLVGIPRPSRSGKIVPRAALLLLSAALSAGAICWQQANQPSFAEPPVAQGSPAAQNAVRAAPLQAPVEPQVEPAVEPAVVPEPDELPKKEEKKKKKKRGKARTRGSVSKVQAERAASESERRREGRAWPGPGPADRVRR